MSIIASRLNDSSLKDEPLEYIEDTPFDSSDTDAMLGSFYLELASRAKSSLHNQAAISKKALEVACSETIQECEGKDVKQWAMMDFAMIRLKLYLKVELSEFDEKIYEEAKKNIRQSPSIDSDDDKGFNSGNFIYAKI
ncbi:hypothetical protein [Campylobacter devanensis]|uniref:hypothetical protein n=1 Tax=Campylobacter devanensis TaxID=3161138 RepID=UPI000A356A04|nr:hypothetical protein [Campylobacter sp. P0139]